MAHIHCQVKESTKILFNGVYWLLGLSIIGMGLFGGLILLIPILLGALFGFTALLAGKVRVLEQDHESDETTESRSGEVDGEDSSLPEAGPAGSDQVPPGVGEAVLDRLADAGYITDHIALDAERASLVGDLIEEVLRKRGWGATLVNVCTDAEMNDAIMGDRR